jgi:hypothetical protein
MFVNISNHPSSKWSQAQKEAAGGEIFDIPFPNVDPKASRFEIAEIALLLMKKIPDGTKKAMVQGEPTLCYALTGLLKREGVLVVVATTERRVIEKEGGVKESVFEFVQFREL